LIGTRARETVGNAPVGWGVVHLRAHDSGPFPPDRAVPRMSNSLTEQRGQRTADEVWAVGPGRRPDAVCLVGHGDRHRPAAIWRRVPDRVEWRVGSAPGERVGDFASGRSAEILGQWFRLSNCAVIG
jgi:hypothetical protein